MPRLGSRFPSPFPIRRPERDLHLLHIGKTGGSALKAALDGAVRGNGGRVICHGHGVTLNQVPRGADVVFALRDPLARLVSGFYSRKRRGRPRYDVPWSVLEERAFTTFPDLADLAHGLLAEDAKTRTAAVEAFDGIQHVRDRFWRWFTAPGPLRHRADDILMIARQERLAQDFEDLKDLAGLPHDLALPDDDLARHSAQTAPPALDTDTRAVLRAATAQDYGFIRLCERELGLRPLRPADHSARAPELSRTQAAANAG